MVTAAAASVVAGAAMLPNWSAGAASTGADDPTVDPATRATFQRLADAVFTDRTDALVDHKENPGHAPLTSRFSGDVQLSSSLEDKEDSALSSLRSRKSRLATLGEQYSSAKTSVSLDKTRVQHRHATVQVTETTTLTYKKVNGDEPKTTGFQAHHELTFKADRQGDWQLTGIRDTDDGYIAVNQVAKPSAAPTVADTGTPEAVRSATTWPAPAKPKNLSAGTYNYKAMAAYAEKYWSRYNPAYPDYNPGAATARTSSASPSRPAGGRTSRARRPTSTSGSPTPPPSRTPGWVSTSSPGSPCPRSGSPASPTSISWTSVTYCRWTSTRTDPRITP
ncbi:hypothetical protein SAV31267_010700 [Streptomyces avermitilis]|uniref:Secreted protein n=1 Tax=Streptomyces avermitilis TaxID=33903 RepID=A0A4D4MIT6_STRAX|nr:hypothetical protein SAV31267_010700 [Streptomyces avermitilis]